MKEFAYQHERFADVQILRYELQGWQDLSVQQRLYIYCLSEAALYGRDITFDQFGKYNLLIRKTLESLWLHYPDRTDKELEALHEYLRQVWFSSGIHHHYGSRKFVPGFTAKWWVAALEKTEEYLPEALHDAAMRAELEAVIFDPEVMPKRVNKADGEDLVRTSACNYYENLTQAEVENFYAEKRKNTDVANAGEPSWGLNSTLVKTDNGEIKEEVWKIGGKYDAALRKIVFWLDKATEYAENEQQKEVIRHLIRYYETGCLEQFDRYSIAWLNEQEGLVDFINGFIEVYGDPLGLKASWEGLVEYKDMEATKRTRIISQHAQWFEDRSPVDSKFKKTEVVGVTATVVCAAMLAGDEYPSTAIGINLPNADWIRAEHGSKSVSISNITHAYHEAAKDNGFLEEFVIDQSVLAQIKQWGSVTDNLHTDLHECLGHGSGRLLPGTSPNALKAYSNTIEEARADLYGLYFMADEAMVRLGLLADDKAYQAEYYTYMMNGLMTQLVRIEPGHQIEEAHMLNRSLIAHWAVDMAPNVVHMEMINGKHYVQIDDYEALRNVFAAQLAEIQRIKSEGDYESARKLVERYAVTVDAALHHEVLERYANLHIAPYKGFLNPKLTVVEKNGVWTDVHVDYSEGYDEQMLRYSTMYSTLI